MDSISNLKDKLNELSINKQEIVKEEFYKDTACICEVGEKRSNSLITSNNIGKLNGKIVLKSEFQFRMILGEEPKTRIQSELKLCIFSFFDGESKEIMDIINKDEREKELVNKLINLAYDPIKKHADYIFDKANIKIKLPNILNVEGE